MKHWRNALVGPDDTILTALAVLENSARRIVLVTDTDDVLLGVVTDGDIRRHILARKSLDDPVTVVMNGHPLTAARDDERAQLLLRMRAHQILQLPRVDQDGRVIGLVTLAELTAAPVLPNQVVLLAGGKGMRLRPLTESCPKPMLKVGRKPILETIIQQFQDCGFNRFVIAVNYMAESITSYFGDGQAMGAEISYVHEEEPLGTAGALTLLPERPAEPFFVMNGDLLTRLDFKGLLAFHGESGSPLTMCLREHTVSVPYGVAEVEGDRLTALVEKPSYPVLVNAGIYVCQPEVLDELPRGQPATMVDLAGALLKQGRRPAVFTVQDYWVDIGRHGDFAQAMADYEQVFG